MKAAAVELFHPSLALLPQQPTAPTKSLVNGSHAPRSAHFVTATNGKGVELGAQERITADDRRHTERYIETVVEAFI